MDTPDVSVFCLNLAVFERDAFSKPLLLNPPEGCKRPLPQHSRCPCTLAGWPVFTLSVPQCSLAFAELSVPGKDMANVGSPLSRLQEIRDKTKSWRGRIYKEIFESRYVMCFLNPVFRTLGRWLSWISLILLHLTEKYIYIYIYTL